MKVLSLFDGMSCGRIALERNGVNVEKYYAAEIDKWATKVSEDNYPDIVRLGDVTKWQDWDIEWGEIDLILGGFPCQAWSMAGKQLGDKDERGMLFWTMLDIISHVRKFNPKADFLIENVKMKKEFEEYITHHTQQALGTVHKILVNSALISAQNRNRYYWTSWECNQPDDKGILLADILENGVVDRDKSWCIDANYFKGGNLKSYFEKHRRQLVFELSKINPRRVDVSINESGVRPHRGDKRKSGVSEFGRMFFTDSKKTYTLTTSHMPILIDELGYRKLTPIECERLQTVPDNYTSCVSNTQRYKMLGNGWTVDVICHLLKCKK